MEGAKVEFEGTACLQHTNYMFYKAFKYKFEDQSKILAVGDFFFLKILQEIPVCIGEIELLWEDKASNQLLSSLRLYFRPEHTPDGRQDDTGEDEVVALGERLVLRLDDLIPLIQHDIKWNYGSTVMCNGGTSTNGTRGGSKQLESKVDSNGQHKDDGCENSKKDGEDCGSKSGCDDHKNGVVVKDENGKKRNCSVTLVKLENVELENIDPACSGAANLAVMSYPKYCRYRAMRKRLEGCENEWLHMAVVVAIGGFSGRSPGCHVMFCRDTFYQSEIDDLDIRMDHMLPILKGRTKGKKSKQLNRKDSQQDSDSMEEMFANITPSISSSSRPRRSTESSEIAEDKVSTEEQAFLIGLHKFMHEAKMPIGRIPSLGFKQIDLFYFYKQAEKLGGYDSITHKRMWKHLYDKLGGNSTNTSAATCTRKHYERLLLPYERHLRKLKLAKQKKKHLRHENDGQLGQEGRGPSSQKENVEVKVKEEKEVKKEEVVETTATKEDIKRLTFNENSQNVNNDSVLRKDKLGPGITEHSKQDPDSEVLEIPVVRHRVPGNGAFQAHDMKLLERDQQSLSYSQIEQLHLQQQQALKSSTNLTSALPAGALMSAENAALPYSNMVYGGGYLLPVIPPHMLQNPWNMLAPVSSSTSTSTSQLKAEGHLSQAGTTTFKDPSSANIPSSSKTNHNVGPGAVSNQDNRSKSSAGKLPASAQSYQLPSPSSSGGVLKTAHTNTPYKPSPYLLKDHIQPTRKNFYPSHLSPNDLLGNSSQNVALLLHPTPPGHKTQRHLPPAPAAIYLNPSNSNPFSPLPSPIMSTPPSAHNHPRKRPYPFDSPGAPSTGVFPSPDMVLDRIRNSTGLPHSNAALANPSSIRQRFEDPRQIFRQSPQTFAASQNAGPSQKKPSLQQQEFSSHNRPPEAKSRNVGRKAQPPYPGYSPMSTMELQQALLQQGHAVHPSSTKVVDSMKSASNSNGLLSSQQSSKAMASAQQSSPIPSSSKDGRLTSALFGTQFTAVPRTTKPSELPSPQSFMSDPAAAAAAMSLNPHLHPAFMSPYLPGGSTTAASAMNPQLQMLAAYGTAPAQAQAQLAAYEEMLRQNGYGAFLAANAQPSKGGKKN